jgi:carbamoyltransferase
MSNVKLNFVLSKHPKVKEVYVFPHMGDGGNALGGALNIAIEKYNITHITMRTAYLGTEFSNSEIENKLKDSELKHRKISSEEKISLAAEYISKGKIVGWFQGRMEYGPRALGARSILASPIDPSINDSLNKRLNRTEFMPFAPVTAPKFAKDFFVGWKESDTATKFMTICYPCTPKLKEIAPAVVHIDNTARPQVILREENPEYHDLICKCNDLYNLPVLINTSFNHHEEPILNSPNDAIRSFKKGNVDYLFIGDYLVGG